MTNKKQYIIFLIFLAIAFLPLINALSCYQEQANQSTIGDGNCNLNYSGSYSIGGNWSDGNWNSGEDIGTNLRQVNYSVPENVLSANFSFSVDDYSPQVIVSVPIPQDCLKSIVSINIKSYPKGFDQTMYLNLTCFDGSQYILLKDTGTPSLYGGTCGGFGSCKFNEEAMNWGTIGEDTSSKDTSCNILKNNYSFIIPFLVIMFIILILGLILYYLLSNIIKDMEKPNISIVGIFIGILIITILVAFGLLFLGAIC